MKGTTGLLMFVLIVCSAVVHANIHLPPLVGNHMVLQRDQELTVWGWAETGEEVTVTFLKNTRTTVADATGRWQIRLPATAAGGPYQMALQGHDTITLHDILVGDVWLCSGQSNMEWSVAQSQKATQETAAAHYPQIRLFTVPRTMSTQPQTTLKEGSWQAVQPATVADFSAVAYFFGRNLHKHLGIPIGLIQSAWGGTKIETWMSASALSALEAYRKEIEDLPSFELEKLSEESQAQDQQWKANLIRYDQGMQDGEALWAQPEADTSTWQNITVPGYWEHVGFEGLDGVVWLRTTFSLPKAIARQGVTLHLGPIYHADMTYLNGQKIGEILDERRRWEPRAYTVPAQHLTGSNVLTVRVENYGGKGGLYGKPEELYLQAADYRQPLHGQWKLKSSTLNLPARPKKIGPNSKPTLLYNGMIHPLISYTIKGVIWYQGESNASKAEAYHQLFPLLIRDWRQQWKDDFPFLFVQLAAFGPPEAQPSGSEWAALREAQHKALSVARTGMAVTIDIGDTYSIHPTNKQDVGQRLALTARKVVYGEDITYSGPVYDTISGQGDTIRVHFEHTGAGLHTQDGARPQEFAIAGEDRQFVSANAVIDGNTVLVWSEQVRNPVAVRYAWADNPERVNLCNQVGLPAAPFRTDQWNLK